MTAAETLRMAAFTPMAINYRGHSPLLALDSSPHLRPFSLPSISLSSSIQLADMDTTMFLLPDNPLLSPFFIVIVALVLLVGAQSFINTMLDGDQGLGAFLRDGSGYNRSGYRPNRSSDNTNNDPLPWLKLPRLDFVEVAGQAEEAQVQREQQEKVYDELDRLRLALNRELENVRKRRQERDLSGIEIENNSDDMAEARRLQMKLEALMTAYGIEYENE